MPSVTSHWHLRLNTVNQFEHGLCQFPKPVWWLLQSKYRCQILRCSLSKFLTVTFSITTPPCTSNLFIAHQHVIPFSHLYLTLHHLFFFYLWLVHLLTFVSLTLLIWTSVLFSDLSLDLWLINSTSLFVIFSVQVCDDLPRSQPHLQGPEIDWVQQLQF